MVFKLNSNMTFTKHDFHKTGSILIAMYRHVAAVIKLVLKTRHRF